MGGVVLQDACCQGAHQRQASVNRKPISNAGEFNAFGTPLLLWPRKQVNLLCRWVGSIRWLGR